MNKKKTKKPLIQTKKQVKRFQEFYYMIPSETKVKALSESIHCVDEEAVEIWLELNLMEVVLTSDSLIFQDAWESFEDPLDLEFIEKNNIKSIYQVSFELQDAEKSNEVLKELMIKHGGFICSDTDDFEPIYKLTDIEQGILQKL